MRDQLGSRSNAAEDLLVIVSSRVHQSQGRARTERPILSKAIYIRKAHARSRFDTIWFAEKSERQGMASTNCVHRRSPAPARGFVNSTGRLRTACRQALVRQNIGLRRSGRHRGAPV